MEEIKQLLKQAEEISKDLKISREEAIMLIIAHHLACIHDHIDKVLWGISLPFIKTVKEKK